MKTALGGVTVIIVIGFWFTRRLPGEPMAAAAPTARAREETTSGTDPPDPDSPDNS